MLRLIPVFTLAFLFGFLNVYSNGNAQEPQACELSKIDLYPSVIYQFDNMVGLEFLSWHPLNNTVVIGYADKTGIETLFIDVESAEILSRINNQEAALIPRVSPNGVYLGSLANFSFELFSIEENKSLYFVDFTTLDPNISHYGISTDVDWNGSSSKVAFINDYNLFILDIQSLELNILRPDEQLEGIYPVAIHWEPDGKELSVYDGLGHIFFINDENSKIEERIEWTVEYGNGGLPYWNAIQALDWSNNNSMIAVIEYDRKEYQLLLWNVIDMSLLEKLSGCNGTIKAIQFSPDSSKLAVAYGQDDINSANPALRVWDLETFEVLVAVEVDKEIVSLDWSNDSQSLISLDNEDGIFLWNLEGLFDG